LSAHANHKLHHQRSRSDLDYMQGQLPIMPNLNSSHIPMLSPHGSPSTTLRKDSPTSRIPVRPLRRTGESPISAPQSRASSSLSNYGGRNKLSKSPTRMKHHVNKENEKASTSTHNRRYNPPDRTSTTKTLTASPLFKTTATSQRSDNSGKPCASSRRSPSESDSQRQTE
jgi:hypothetical protein